MATTVNRILSNPRQRRAVETNLAAKGVKGDTILAHITPREAGILRQFGGSGTRNPKTGLLQFSPTDHSAAGNGGDSGGLGSGPNHGSGGSPVDHNPADNGGNAGPGGFGNASDGHSSMGSGAGAGGGHSGQNFTSQQFGNQLPVIQQQSASPAPPPPGVGLPSAVPIPTTALMSQSPGNLVGGAFGALPSWATQSYQIGTAPTSYPVGSQPTGGIRSDVAPALGAGGAGGAGGVSGGITGNGQQGGNGGGGGIPGYAPGSVGANALPSGNGVLNAPIGGTSPLASKTIPQILAMHLSPGALNRLSTPLNPWLILPGQPHPQQQQAQPHPQPAMQAKSGGFFTAPAYQAPKPAPKPAARPAILTTQTAAQKTAAAKLAAAQASAQARR